MVKNVYDMDEKKWAAYEPGHGYQSAWLPEKAYRKWLYANRGIIGTSLSGKNMMLRSEADDMEAKRCRKI